MGKSNVLSHGKRFASVAGVYAIFQADRLLYIGSSINIRSRIWAHLATARFIGVKGLSVKYKKSQRYGDWLMTEARLLKRLRPRLNKVVFSRNVSGVIRRRT